MTDVLSDQVQSPQATAWRVYGIVPAGTSIPNLPESSEGDLAHRNVDVLPYGEVAAVVEPIGADQGTRRRELLAHSELLNLLAEHVPVVPVAFGSAFVEREQIVVELLAPQQAALASMLDQLRGHAEFVLRVRYSMDDLLADVVGHDSEIADLRDATRDLPEHEGHNAKMRLGELVSRAVEARQADDVDWLLAQLEPTVDDMQITGRSAAEGTISLAFLVGDAQRPAFEAAAEEAAERMSGRAILELRGPLAAFDFVPEE